MDFESKLALLICAVFFGVLSMVGCHETETALTDRAAIAAGLVQKQVPRPGSTATDIIWVKPEGGSEPRGVVFTNFQWLGTNLIETNPVLKTNIIPTAATNYVYGVVETNAAYGIGAVSTNSDALVEAIREALSDANSMFHWNGRDAYTNAHGDKVRVPDNGEREWNNAHPEIEPEAEAGPSRRNEL